MNRNKLIEQGYTQDEAEDLQWAQAESQADAERDREVEENLTQGESK